MVGRWLVGVSCLLVGWGRKLESQVLSEVLSQVEVLEYSTVPIDSAYRIVFFPIFILSFLLQYSSTNLSSSTSPYPALEVQHFNIRSYECIPSTAHLYSSFVSLPLFFVAVKPR